MSEAELIDAMATMLLEVKGMPIEVHTLANSYSVGTLEDVVRGWIILETQPEHFEYIALRNVVRWWIDSSEDDDEPAVITESDLIAACREVDEEMAR